MSLVFILNRNDETMYEMYHEDQHGNKRIIGVVHVDTLTDMGADNYTPLRKDDKGVWIKGTYIREVTAEIVF